MLYLEQMLLKHNVCEKAQSIKEMPGGMDIYWGSKSGANHLIEFLKGVVPIRTTIAKKLISQDDNCFPAADHQILTDVGFMSLGDVHAAIQRNGHVQVACYVQKSRTIEFHPVGADGVVDKLVEEPLIEFSRPTHPAAGFDNQLNLQVTADHEMYVHAGKGESTWHKVTAAEMYSNKSVPSKVHMLGFADGGVAARDFSTPGFAAALGLTTADEITAFLELYGQ
jgi:hypothetical protein